MNIIFDLDGTPGNTLPLCIAAFRKAIEPYLGRSITDAEIIDQFGPSEEGTIRTLAPDDYDTALESYLDGYRKLHANYPEPFEGIPEILEFLRERDAFIGMVTGKGERSTSITLEQYGLEKFFDIIKTGSPTGPVKPERIEELISERNDPKESYLYVGDSPGDVDACRVVGIGIVGAAWAETTDSCRLRLRKPDYFFDSIPDFKVFLEERKVPNRHDPC